MSDWIFLNKQRCRALGDFYSDESFGFNGVFCFNLPGETRPIYCICSDGLGWQHVSVSFGKGAKRCPSWEIMCRVKDLFWEPTDWVVQFHPPASEYVNNHPGCLHLWRCIDGRSFPTPPAELVGIKGLKHMTDDQAATIHLLLRTNALGAFPPPAQ